MLDIVTIGTATKDVFLTSPLFKVLRDKEHLERLGFKTGEAECFALGSKIQIEEPIFTSGGGAFNSAVTFARQGLKVGIFAKVGNDEAGKELQSHTKNEGITPFFLVDKKNKSGYSTVLLAPGGERTILVYRGASHQIKSGEVPVRKIKSNWAYISPGEIPFQTMETIILALKKNGTRIAMNPSRHYLGAKKDFLERIFGFLDVVIVNREEASYVTKRPYDEEHLIFKAFDNLVPGIAVVTDGPRGALVSDGRFLYKAGVFPEKKKIDRTGAGDAFGSGFIAGLIQKNDIYYALRLASANATSVIEKIGATEGAIKKRNFSSKRWKALNMDVEPL